MTLFDGITSRVIETDRLATGVLERTGDDPATPPERTVVLIHGNVSSSLFWQELMQDLPSDLRVIAIDLRGFGNSEHAPIDATRGVREFSDDVHAALTALGIETAHFVGWSLGAGVVMQYALEHPVLSLTLEAPVSPYGFGGTRRDGSRLTDDDAGVGGGAANPDFVQRLTDHDTTDEAQTSPRSVFRSGYVAPDYESPYEDVWVESMLSTSTATGNYPGDSVDSVNWPGFAAGTTACSTRWRPSTSTCPASSISTRSPRCSGCTARRMPSCRTSRSTTSTTGVRRARSRGGQARTSHPRSRWCRRRATCSSSTGSAAARSPSSSSRAWATRRTWSVRRSSATLFCR